MTGRQKQEVCRKPLTPSSPRLLCSFKWNQMGPLAGSHVSHRGCLKLDNGLLMKRRREFPLTICSPLVSPHTSSVSMQSFSSNSSRDAHEKNWSARGSCHVSLCIQSSSNLHTQPVFYCDAYYCISPKINIKVLILSLYYSISQHPPD